MRPCARAPLIRETSHAPPRDAQQIDTGSITTLPIVAGAFASTGTFASGVDTASAFMHSESGYLQEIAQEVAMRNSQNVWVDGTLKHGHYFASVFREVR